ncbi:MAG: sulfatase-like hydrolase/transferase [Acidobacteriaceae bacterium]|nr:sulfatase-like hydrolase/transferase [Acidobacteriaceae bacterium]
MAHSVAAGAALGIGKAVPAEPDSQVSTSAARPNVIVFHADQFRADFVGANGQNYTTRTPNLDAMAVRGTNFSGAVTNQPLCSPSRAVLMTGRYATETGRWRNSQTTDWSLPTLAGEFRKAGYSANYIGKWHLAPGSVRGYVEPEQRGGFLDLWEASNELEITTLPYAGTIWDGSGKEITFRDQYRVDFLTDRAERFLRQKHDRPFLLFISQLEPHFQNYVPPSLVPEWQAAAEQRHDSRPLPRYVGPEGSELRFQDPCVPGDLRSLPGAWQSQLPDYYGDVEAIDNSVGRILKILDEEKLTDNTIVVFTSDHGCHFETRNEEAKRSPHNASIRIPLIVQGPGFNHALNLPEIIGNIHVMPTLLDAAGIAIPSSVKGHSFLSLISQPEARKAWPNKELVQISESMTGRALRTKDWTYCVIDAQGRPDDEFSDKYVEYQMYSQASDPSEQVNLAGRKEYRAIAEKLREELKAMMTAAGEPPAEIEPVKHYP